MSTLLIIGNGFDLQCKLNSHYEYFFEWLRKDQNRTRNNLWAVHFLNNPPTGQLWTDVEKSLKQALNGRSPTIKSWEYEARNFFDIRGRISSEATYMYNHIIDMANHKRTTAISFFPISLYWYLDELRKFEYLFSEYLKAEVSSSINYLPNAFKLMSMIAKDEQVDVISFNYTNPFSSDYYNDEGERLSDMIASVTNVHGTYDENNIIFGVDATEELMANAHIFTKTHRKMLLDNPIRALPWHIQKIKFYGHSLGKADYSYFQSIFDNYNLYGGDLASGNPRNEQVELQFYFTIYDENKKTEIMRNAADRVYKLITVYGTTLNNKDKGKNLLHKLLLENRVKIEFLPNV